MHEPLTAGIPLPPGLAHDTRELTLSDSEGSPVPVQWTVLDRWPADGSIRWALADCRLHAPGTYALVHGQEATAAPHQDAVTCSREGDRWTVSSGGCTHVVERGAHALLSTIVEGEPTASVLAFTLDDRDNQPLSFVVRGVAAEAMGPLRTTLRLDGTIGAPAPLLNVVARVSFFAGAPAVRVELTLHNPRRAKHAGGYWELGDPGSVLFSDASLVLTGRASERILCSEHPGAQSLELPVPSSIVQHSSGGEHWQSRVHVNRHGVVPMRIRGYELHAPGVDRTGLRATPTMWRGDPDRSAAVAVRHFWQNFPKALEAERDRLIVRLFPRQAGDLHELQGGEQKTHVVGVAFGRDRIAQRPLDWITRPVLAAAPPAWYVQARAVPYLAPVTDPDSPYEALVRGAIDGPDSFERKREAIDEYGWRNFGDIYADHESVFAPPGAPLVSHYNNQYDAIGGFAAQFMRSGDLRWWVAMDELARHVVDIDIYHTQEDKAAYNGGLFWHTFHYRDAGRATHRCYPRAEGVNGGGPSNEQNYSTGLMYYYLLTGAVWAREAVIELAEWVIAMDDGSRTIFRWLSRGPTGHASATASTAYHGPGRGAGNSIVTLLNAFRLTGERRYLGQAEMLIARCIHPNDDIAARDLLDAERKWSYTVFLQALARYLDDKALMGELDERYAYARSSLLAYAKWMAEHEYPFLERPEILEHPTETWAAQDMRKCEVFLHASRHTSGVEKASFLDRADFFSRASLERLYRFSTHTRARPVVLMLSCGYMHVTASQGNGLDEASKGPQGCEFAAPLNFVPQRIAALRITRPIAVLAGVALLVILRWVLGLA